MSQIKKIMVVGSQSGQTKQRTQALRNLGYELVIINETPDGFAPGINYHPSLLDRIRHRFGLPKDKSGLNQQILATLKTHDCQLIWVDKCLVLKPFILKTIKAQYPKIILAWYSGDDMFARHNQSRYFRRGLSFYDFVFTTKSYNCDPNELAALGARNVVYIEKGYDQTLHKPIDVTAEDIQKFGGDVVFIGTFEQDRAEKMLYLAKNGIQVRVWGNNWRGWVNKHPQLQVENRPIYEQDFQISICATKINLCFLRKLNRDLHTDRSIEIPACGGFMLAERTYEHQKLFVENKEAVFFDMNHPEELLHKIKYYLMHDVERKKIAKAGYQRCINEDYSHENRLRTMLTYINQHMDTANAN